MSKKKGVLLLLLTVWVCFCLVWFFVIYKKEEKKTGEGLSVKAPLQNPAATVSGYTNEVNIADSSTASIRLAADTIITDVKQAAVVATVNNTTPQEKTPDKQPDAGTVTDSSKPINNTGVKNKLSNTTASGSLGKKKVSVYYFYPNSDKKIKKISQKILAKLQSYPKLDGSTKITITGHTDFTGSAAYNYNLGLQRAERIKRLLIKRGIAAERIVVLSKGEEQPVTSNKTPKGRAKNRRVEIDITTS
jgi:outer membrane protein OmpA-like peptidoglycan-associated protein